MYVCLHMYIYEHIIVYTIYMYAFFGTDMFIYEKRLLRSKEKSEDYSIQDRGESEK